MKSRPDRITANTHILHVADGPNLNFVRLAVFTGIYDDPIEYSYDPNDPFYWGGRIGGVKEMESRLADKPPYIWFKMPAPAGMNLSPEGYRRMFFATATCACSASTVLATTLDPIILITPV